MTDISLIKNWHYHQHYFNKNWHYHKVPIEILLGDRPLYTRYLWMQVREIALEDNNYPISKLTPPSDALYENSQGFLVRSQCVAEKQPILQKLQNYISFVPHQYSRYYIDMRQSFEEYKSKFSSKTISTINRKIRKFAKFCNGDITWKIFTSPDEMDSFYQLARTISKKTYQEKIFDEGLPDSSIFLNEMKVIAKLGKVLGFILFHKDKPVSYMYCPVSDHTLIYAYVGYDPDYKKYSVGTVLYWLTLEYLFKNPAFYFFDFTEGESEQKRLFATNKIKCANIFFMRYNLHNIFMLNAKKNVDNFCSSVGLLLNKTGHKDTVKKVLRFGK